MILILSRLFRLRLVMMNGISALGGYLLFPAGPVTSTLCALFVGVSFLAAAGSALNQVLERESDPLMQRTRNRPIPKGELSAAAAIIIGVGCLGSGLAIVVAIGGVLPALIGTAALLWYLAIYTPLKRRTSFALALGALCGAAPPVIGWCVAGGSPADFRVILLAGILYLWQVPHFWLLQRRHADDYRRAGFPLFAPSGYGRGVAPVCGLWIVAMIAGAMMLPAFGIVGGNPALWCAALCAPLLITAVKRCEAALFACLNLFPVLVTLALCAGR
ncbi:MAG: protoheme IX farnesyltransferase [Geobacteraceae bacterium GWC2_58_44]|nr:MAG: protoheme IX farnesyltransferase [Geobacteraceae bacterium GWC2_58_44]HBG07970.1 protoheme IX farnesyltransferase [Geobacter sp.]